MHLHTEYRQQTETSKWCLEEFDLLNPKRQHKLYRRKLYRHQLCIEWQY